MKPLGVLVLVLVAVGGLFLAINLLGGDQGSGEESLDTLTQESVEPDTAPREDTSLTPTSNREQGSAPVAVGDGARVDAAPEASEHYGNEVTGLILSPDQKPIAGAKVILTQAGLSGRIFQNEPLDRSKDRSATTNEEGRYSFLDVEPFNQYSVEAQAEGYCREESASFAAHATGEVEVTDIILTLGGSLVGTVTDTGGNPVPDATLILEGLFAQFGDGPAPDSLVTKSEPDGSYLIPNIPPGNRRLQISAEGYANQTKGGLVFQGEEPLTMDVTLEVAEMICGKVISKAGSPIAEANVLAMSFSNSNSQCRDEVLTDENGEFCLERLAAGKYNLSVRADGYRRAHEPRVLTGGSGLVIELVDQGRVSGRVTVAGGEVPIPYEVQLRQTHEGSDITNLVGESKLFKEADGSFSIECSSSGTFLIQAQAPGYAPSFSQEFRYTMGQAMTGVTVRLTQGGKITGRLVDSDGNPVPRPRITTHDNTWTNSLFDVALGDQFPTNITHAATTGNMDGKFRLKLLKAETYQLSFQAAGFCEQSMRDVLVTEGNETNIGDVTLIRGGEITGSVMDLAGQPVAGAMVRLIPESQARATLGSYETRAGGGGKYTLKNIMPGKYKLTASRQQGEMDFLGAFGDEVDRMQIVNISDGQSLRYELKVGQ